MSSHHSTSRLNTSTSHLNPSTSHLITQYQPPQPPPIQARSQPLTFSPRRLIENIVSRFHYQKDAGRLAVMLAMEYFFGQDYMSRHTTATLEPDRMLQLKAIVLSKFAARRSEPDREHLWGKWRIAIGQKCKSLRAIARATQSDNSDYR